MNCPSCKEKMRELNKTYYTCDNSSCRLCDKPQGPPPEEEHSGFYKLLRAHDKIWADRTLPLEHRMETTQTLWDLALSFTKMEKTQCVMLSPHSSSSERAAWGAWAKTFPPHLNHIPFTTVFRNINSWMDITSYSLEPSERQSAPICTPPVATSPLRTQEQS
jgi:hypothetical protein